MTEPIGVVVRKKVVTKVVVVAVEGL